MLQVKDIPNAEILQKFADRYPQTDIKNVMTFLLCTYVTLHVQLPMSERKPWQPPPLRIIVSMY